jgi:hypothetical protein
MRVEKYEQSRKDVLRAAKTIFQIYYIFSWIFEKIHSPFLSGQWKFGVKDRLKLQKRRDKSAIYLPSHPLHAVFRCTVKRCEHLSLSRLKSTKKLRGRDIISSSAVQRNIPVTQQRRRHQTPMRKRSLPTYPPYPQRHRISLISTREFFRTRETSINSNNDS